MREEKYLSRKSVAEILGCSEQSVSNFAARGYFRSYKCDKYLLVDRESLYAFIEKNFAESMEVENINERIENEKAKVTEYEEKVRAYAYLLKHASEGMLSLGNSYSQDVLTEYISAATSTIDPESCKRAVLAINIVKEFCKGASFKYLEDKYHLSQVTIMRMACRGMSLIRKNGGCLKELKGENERLMAKCARQHEEIKRLQSENELLKRTKARRSESAKTAKAMAKTSLVSVKNIDFSVRTRNVLEAMRVCTLCDLLRHTALEIRRSRNCGVKTLREIEDFVTAYSKKNKEFNYTLGCFKCG